LYSVVRSASELAIGEIFIHLRVKKRKTLDPPLSIMIKQHIGRE